jgi:molybdenum cofactor guanylyltransferase
MKGELTNPAFSIVIQAGGESRRMGKDKALLPFLGQPLILRIIKRVAPLADDLFITTNKPENYRFLDVPLVQDLLPGKGALGGLYTALSAAKSSLVGVVACDMPFVNPEILKYGKHMLERERFAAVIPESETGLEPFHAIYRRETCLAVIEKALESNKFRVDSWFADANIYFLTPREIRRFDPDQLAFININTAEELARAEKLSFRNGGS